VCVCERGSCSNKQGRKEATISCKNNFLTRRILMYGLSDSTKSLASVSKPNLMSQVGRVHEVMCIDQCVSRRESSAFAIP
jgi:hypothetical protein